jgi:hypothetical protein
LKGTPLYSSYRAGKFNKPIFKKDKNIYRYLELEGELKVYLYGKLETFNLLRNAGFKKLRYIPSVI